MIHTIRYLHVIFFVLDNRALLINMFYFSTQNQILLLIKFSTLLSNVEVEKKKNSKRVARKRESCLKLLAFPAFRLFHFFPFLIFWGRRGTAARDWVYVIRFGVCMWSLEYKCFFEAVCYHSNSKNG